MLAISDACQISKQLVHSHWHRGRLKLVLLLDARAQVSHCRWFQYVASFQLGWSQWLLLFFYKSSWCCFVVVQSEWFFSNSASQFTFHSLIFNPEWISKFLALQQRHANSFSRLFTHANSFSCHFKYATHFWLWGRFQLLPYLDTKCASATTTDDGSIFCPKAEASFAQSAFRRSSPETMVILSSNASEIKQRKNWIAHVNRAVLSLLWETSSFSSCASLKTLNGDRLSFRWVGNCEWASKYSR